MNQTLVDVCLNCNELIVFFLERKEITEARIAYLDIKYSFSFFLSSLANERVQEREKNQTKEFFVFLSRYDR